ncbi:MAG: hypothetical protein KF805_14335 [Phycisphaeraceae bacterium]|nr:hypothetical protein [Phycisphaeraceae bacterium]
MLDNIKTILLVSVITVLVWVFAEAETLQRREVRFTLQFVSDAPTERAIQSEDSFRGTVTVSFSGSAAAFTPAEELARSGPLTFAIGSPGIPASPGEYVISLRDAMRADPTLRKLGLTIDRVEPPTVRVHVEAMEMRTARVVVDVGDSELDGVPEVRPATVKLYLPSDVAGAAGSTPEVFATLRPEDLARLLAGRRETVSQVRLELPIALKNKRAARIEPPTASVTLAVRKRQATAELTGVPVQVRIAPGELSRWDISIPEQDRFIPKVTVSGPADYVDQVKRGEIKVVATINLSFEDLEKGVTQKDVVFSEFPSLLKFETETRLVRINIKKR